jgi:CCR4-NOT transcription complex subunit 4
VRAFSALPSGSPIDSLPVEAIDTAVTSFQQVLEMLSRTISDLLRLLPRLTWTDTASVDAMLKDMVRSGELMEEEGLGAAAAAAEAAYDNRTEGVTALTDALSKRARWMEAQLAKLESLHHDVNSAAVRVVMYFNDRGWDHAGKLPRPGDALVNFDALGSVKEGSGTRKMTANELKAALASSLQEEAQLEAKLREAIQANQRLLAFSAN